MIPLMKKILSSQPALLVAARALAARPRSDRIVVLISGRWLAHYYFDDFPRRDADDRSARRRGRARYGMKCSMPTVTLAEPHEPS